MFCGSGPVIPLICRFDNSLPGKPFRVQAGPNYALVRDGRYHGKGGARCFRL
jgi:hypothetical protein